MRHTVLIPAPNLDPKLAELPRTSPILKRVAAVFAKRLPEHLPADELESVRPLIKRQRYFFVRKDGALFLKIVLGR